MAARVQITTPNGHARGTKVVVDGVEVNRLTRVDVSIDIDKPNVVRLHLIARAQDIDIGAEVRIGGTIIPEAVERALLAYLVAKYPDAEAA